MHIAFDCRVNCINEIISLEGCLRLGSGHIILIVIVIENFFLHVLSGIGLLIFICSLLDIFNCEDCNFIKVSGNLLLHLNQ